MKKSPEKRQRIRTRLELFRKLPPEEKKRLRASRERFKNMDPERKQKLREQFKNMSSEDRKNFRERTQKRREWLKSARKFARNRMSEGKDSNRLLLKKRSGGIGKIELINSGIEGTGSKPENRDQTVHEPLSRTAVLVLRVRTGAHILPVTGGGINFFCYGDL